MNVVTLQDFVDAVFVTDEDGRKRAKSSFLFYLRSFW